jgi:hypothetical protein
MDFPMRLLKLFIKQSRPETSLPLYGFTRTNSEPEPVPGRQWLYILLLTLIFCGGYYHLVLNRVLVELTLVTDTRTVMKFYWPNEQGNYSEQHMARMEIKPGKSNYRIRVTDIAGLDHLRLDPSERPAWITIKRIVLEQSGYPPFQLTNKAGFAHLQPMAGVESLTRNDHEIRFHANSRDPQFKLLLPAMDHRFLGLSDFGTGLSLVLLALGCYILFRHFFQGTAFIPLLGAFALALILVMAGISGYNTHPDESVHVAAGKYYMNHNIPPRIGDPAIEHTYSQYGVSRLHSGEIIYLVTGWFERILRPFHLPPFKSMRLFNVLLFMVLVLYAFNKVDFRFFLFPMLLSSQIWYVFSYYNSDAFSTFICLIAAYQLAGTDSAFTALIRGNHGKFSWPAAGLLGILFGLLLLQKQNFYFLYVFFFFYFFWKIRLERMVWTRAVAYRFATVVLIGLTLFAAFRGVDSWVNDFNKKDMLFQARQKYASRLYNPDTPLEKRHAYLQMKERGKKLKHMLLFDRWGENSFRTAFGVYGYTQYSGSFSYYEYVRTVTVLLLLTVIISVLIQGRLEGILLLTLCLGYGVFLIAGLIYHAWTVDYQAQGRYLLPLVPMLAILVYHCRKIINKPIFYSLFFLLFSLSTYNYIFVGLREIGK